MQEPKIHQCTCSHCRNPREHPDKQEHRWMNVLLSRLNEAQRRWYLGLESLRLGHGGDRYLARITGIDPRTIARGRREIEAGVEFPAFDRVRRPGAGRPRVEKKIRQSPSG